MTTAYQHRPLSKILAPAAATPAEASSADQKRDPITGQFVPAEAAPTEVTQFTLPEKYVGKTVDEVASMHMNAEKELGRVRNEVGTYRGLVNALTSLQRTPEAVKPVEPEKIDVSGDDILRDPSEAIDRVVTQRLAERDAKSTETAVQTQFELEGAALLEAYPQIDQIVGSTEFQAFASRTPSRQNDFIVAARGEGLDQVRAARRLLEDFVDFRTAGTATQDPANANVAVLPTPTEQARAASTEGAGPTGAVSTKPQIFESDVIKLIHSDPAKYRSPSFQGELMSAIKEGRYVKTG